MAVIGRRSFLAGAATATAGLAIPAFAQTPRRGGVLRFRVALTNRESSPFAFADCPVYVERVATAHFRDSYVLNCKEAGAFAPGERKVFAMELRVPADAPLGRQSLMWILGPQTYDNPWVPATILVTP